MSPRRKGGRRAQRRPRGQGDGPFGASEVTQSRIQLRPTYGPTVRISRSVVYDWTRTAADGGFFMDWSLGDVPNSSEFTALFAQWKLAGAAFTITWRSANEANPVRPTVYFALDPFATAAPSALAEVLERPNRTWTPNAQRTVLQVSCRPRAIALSASGAGSGSLVINSLAGQDQWYTCASPQLSYGSVLFWVANWGAGAGTIQVKQDYMFCFRSPR